MDEQQRLIHGVVDALGEKHRLPILLRYVPGLTVPEIAEMLHEKDGTIYSRLHYALRRPVPTVKPQLAQARLYPKVSLLRR